MYVKHINGFGEEQRTPLYAEFTDVHRKQWVVTSGRSGETEPIVLPRDEIQLVRTTHITDWNKQ